MPFVVRLAAEVARQHNWRGSRRRVCTFASGPRMVVFSRSAVTLDELPPEVAADPYLLVTEIVPEVSAPEPVEPPKPTTKKHRKPRWD